MTGPFAAVPERLKRVVPAPAKRLLRRLLGGGRPDQVDAARPTEGMLSHHGLCSICGHHGLFEEDADARFAARAFPCPNCQATVRFRNEASVIIDELGRGCHLSLSTLLTDERCSALSFYNTGIAGPVRGALRSLPHFVESTYHDGATPGEERDGVMHQDLQALTFPDNSFDVVTSSHVLEHVADPGLAFDELFRVLRPGGRLIFSVPIPWPPPRTSVQRARMVNGEIEHLKPAAYHESPSGVPSLVFTDFGSDVLDMLEQRGFSASQRRPQMSIELAYRDSVLVAVKPS